MPATTTNLGSGFDCLGMALEVYKTVTAQVVPSGLDVRVTGEGEEALLWGEENRVLRAMRLVYQQASRRLPGLRLDLENTSPLGRGLGSSAAASVGGLVVAVVDGERLVCAPVPSSGCCAALASANARIEPRREATSA